MSDLLGTLVQVWAAGMGVPADRVPHDLFSGDERTAAAIEQHRSVPVPVDEDGLVDLAVYRRSRDGWLLLKPDERSIEGDEF